ncbi:MAG TPA: ComEC/Rec2 family competence protein [Prolixibacteraceae bacterium]|nr:ComEC/Rec2 family competence protein [Prolixibacteraceae bacterium]
MKPQKVPFLKYTLAAVTGILFAKHITCSEIYYWLSLMLLVVFVALKFVIKTKTKQYSKTLFITTFILFVSVWFIYTSVYTQQQFNKNLPLSARYVGQIEEKTSSANKDRLTVSLKMAYTSDSTYQLSEKIVINSYDTIFNKTLSWGDYIIFKSNLKPITSQGNPGEFNYQRFMLQKGIRYQAYLFKGIEKFPNKEKSIKTTALNIRQNLLKKYKAFGINNDQFAVLSALTLGEKSYLDSHIRESFSASGAMHVLAVSGLHVGIIFVILNLLLKPIGKSQKARVSKTILCIVLLWGYAFITGLSPSVMRASTMFSFIVIGENLKRTPNIYNTLLVSAFFLMLINPLIISEVGFQLSYAAVLSIVYFQPKIVSLFEFKNRILKYLWELFAVSLAAQVGTFAISIYYFHQFPVYFWLSNFIVIPSAGIILYSAVLFFTFSWLPIVAQLFAFVLNVVTRFMNSGIQIIEQLPASVIKNLWIDNFSLIVTLLIIVSIAIAIELKKYNTLLICLLLLLTEMMHVTIQNISSQNQSIIVFYNSYSDPLISFIDGKNHFFYSPNNEISPNAQQLLDNTSGTYSTNEAININSIEKQNNISLHKTYLLFKYLSIEIENENTTHYTTGLQHDFIWKPKQGEVIIKNALGTTLKQQNKTKSNIIESTKKKEVISTKNDGALMVFM